VCVCVWLLIVASRRVRLLYTVARWIVNSSSSGEGKQLQYLC